MVVEHVHSVLMCHPQLQYFKVGIQIMGHGSQSKTIVKMLTENAHIPLHYKSLFNKCNYNITATKKQHF